MQILDLETENVSDLSDFCKEGTEKYLLNKGPTSLLKNERQSFNMTVISIL